MHLRRAREPRARAHEVDARGRVLAERTGAAALTVRVAAPSPAGLHAGLSAAEATGCGRALAVPATRSKPSAELGVGDRPGQPAVRAGGEAGSAACAEARVRAWGCRD